MEAVIPEPEGKGEGVIILMVSTAPIPGKDLALVFLEDLTEFRRKGKTEID